MVDPLEATVSCKGSHRFQCCVEEDEDYRVTFQMESIIFPAGKMTTAGLDIVSCIRSLKTLKVGVKRQGLHQRQNVTE